MGPLFLDQDMAFRTTQVTIESKVRLLCPSHWGNDPARCLLGFSSIFQVVSGQVLLYYTLSIPVLSFFLSVPSPCSAIVFLYFV